MGQKGNAYKMIVEEHEKRPRRKPKRKLED
jgi:hypothetical protein